MSSLKTYVLFTCLLPLSPRLLTLQLNPDVNPFQRSFVGEIRRIEDMARRVRFFATQIERERDPISIRPLYDSAPLIAFGPRAAQTIDDLDVTLNEHESRLLEMNSAFELLSERLAELIEARHVLRETAVFFRRVRASYDYHISLSIRALSSPFRPNRVRMRFARPLMIVLPLCSSMKIAKISIPQCRMSSSTLSNALPPPLAL